MDEEQRLAVLESFGILDTPPEEQYQDLVELAAAICDVPISLISLVDRDRQWFKARVGLDLTETSREVAFCARAIEGNEPFVVADALLDPLFAGNPLVTGSPGIRFYAGIPLVSVEGFNLGTLCAIDRAPRVLSDAQLHALKVLSRHATLELEYHRKARELARSLAGREAALQALRSSEAETRKLYEAERAAHAAAEKARRDREELLAVVSHDLRNPLAAVLLSAASLKSEMAPLSPVKARRLDTIFRACEQMTHLTEDLLDIAAIEAGRLSLHREQVSVDALLLEIAEVQSELATTRQIKLDIGAPPVPCFVFADRGRLTQVFSNLIGNAIKFCPPGGTVRVSVLSAPSQLTFSVRDDGPGIPAAALEHVFDRFWKEGGRAGVGLGLSIVQGIVAAHGGRVWVESASGEGTNVSFTLAPAA